MLKYGLAYFVTVVIFLALDMLWLGTMATSFYRARIPDIVASDVNYAPAILFYLIYAVGVVIFALSPAMETGRWHTALIYGALFGFFAYATYDLTSQATLKQWSSALTIVDIAWGTFASGLSATLSFLATNWLLARLS